MLADHQFRPAISKRGTFLEPDIYLSNPYLPDAILKELYVPFDQTNDGNFKSLEVRLEHRNYFNDPSFTDDGLEILFRFLKLLVLDSKITSTWIESENWRKIFDNQLIQSQIKRTNFTARLPSMKFDSSQGDTFKESTVEVLMLTVIHITRKKKKTIWTWKSMML